MTTNEEILLKKWLLLELMDLARQDEAKEMNHFRDYKNETVIEQKEQRIAELEELVRDIYEESPCPDKTKCKDELCQRMQKALNKEEKE